ncbi:hypothetical protein A9P44_08695 [Paenibacillus polymyxa]|uniref:ClbS/DfsB family four-helix bundle protein n=1 Tax=Paenibacillus jamilae TaxID=114136 RepID=UPI0007AB63B8|nr:MULTISPECIES: ClbS/DfsB family four-helix bundle protein [Paenibacillus]KZE82632.1 hypothetical protein AV545_00040 [Paenibacillus jamilae]OBA07631.1 hypothetical protein A9P44_08695 [Paenibacillus polymyxa]
MSSYDYASKLELKEAIHASYLLFDNEFQEIDESLKDTRIAEVDKTPAEMIAYQLGWLDWVDTLSHEELFTQGIHKWTGTNPNWPMARWIHINSVAPFKTFRAKIRKWKKYNVQH